MIEAAAEPHTMAEGDMLLDIAKLFEQGGAMSSLAWRMNNLYAIVDEHAKVVPFRMNEEQADFIAHLHYRNLILKARQLGFSTLVELLQFDQALFNADHNGVVIADTVPNAQKLFGKIELALKRLNPALAQALPLESRTANTSLKWRHGSSIYVSTSSRGGTVHLLHVSEFGKTARKWPERAAEIVSGAFASVPRDGVIIIESTAEGAAGEFYDLCMPALKRKQEGAPETILDWRLHFYPWWKKASYRLPVQDVPKVAISDAMAAYFNKMQAECQTRFDDQQRAWYVKTQETQGRKMKREYPSTPEEAFEQATEGAIFGVEMTRVRELGRIGVVPLDPSVKVNTFWDFGTADATAIWFHQRIGLQNRWVKYIEGTGTGLGAWWRRCEAFRMESGEFLWGHHYLPHDATADIQGESITTKAAILDKAGMRNQIVVGRVALKETAIDLARSALPVDNWFDRIECAQGIKVLDGYQYEWNEKRGMWSNEPLHNWASHGADAWMQYAQGYQPNVGVGGPEDASLRRFKNRKRG